MQLLVHRLSWPWPIWVLLSRYSAGQKRGCRQMLLMGLLLLLVVMGNGSVCQGSQLEKSII
jgi:hypothetical protein